MDNHSSVRRLIYSPGKEINHLAKVSKFPDIFIGLNIYNIRIGCCERFKQGNLPIIVSARLYKAPQFRLGQVDGYMRAFQQLLSIYIEYLY